MFHLINMSLLLALFWLGLSGHYTALLLAFGALSVGLVVWLAKRMDVIDHESVPLHFTRRALTFWPWLMVEIVKSNIDVVRRVLDPRHESAARDHLRQRHHADPGHRLA